MEWGPGPGTSGAGKPGAWAGLGQQHPAGAPSLLGDNHCCSLLPGGLCATGRGLRADLTTAPRIRGVSRGHAEAFFFAATTSTLQD